MKTYVFNRLNDPVQKSYLAFSIQYCGHTVTALAGVTIRLILTFSRGGGKILGLQNPDSEWEGRTGVLTTL